jgi:hypothetical protein
MSRKQTLEAIRTAIEVSSWDRYANGIVELAASTPRDWAALLDRERLLPKTITTEILTALDGLSPTAAKHRRVHSAAI